MKSAALDVLVCPACKTSLAAPATVTTGREILHGTLTCGSCQAEYPIRSGVLPKYQFKYLYPEVFRWYQDAGFRELDVFGDPARMSGQKRRTTETSDGTERRWRDLVAS